jgi:hypothetical protein
MKLNEITAEEVLAGKLWIIVPGQDGETNPTVKETIGFTGEDLGLISRWCGSRTDRNIWAWW